MRTVGIVGGGAAGMMAAVYALRAGARVVLMERNEKLGKKVYITGKGRCNLTNAAEREDFFANIPRNPKFFRAAFAHLDNQATIALFESLGCPVKIERGERAFPESDKASDVTCALAREIHRLGGEVRYNARVAALTDAGVRMENGELLAFDAVILATGGITYPSTGSTGDGYALAASVGHTVTKTRAALVPLETRETFCGRLTGLSLKNVVLSAKIGNRVHREMGEMLFTHFGVSGPLVLSVSSLLDELPGAALSIDLKPALDEKTLDARLLRDFDAMKNRQLGTVMDGLVPRALGVELLGLLNVSPQMPVNAVTAAMRKQIVRLLKDVPLTVARPRPETEAVITRGGVDVREVNPSTMGSRLRKGLYFAGELLDIDALTGGFNLQIAFSTGALAGEKAATEVAQ